MTMLSINTNVGALTAAQHSYSVNKSMETSMNRLSSGKRINSAADDAGGIQIANRMNTEIMGLHQAVRNAADSQAFLMTAEGAADVKAPKSRTISMKEARQHPMYHEAMAERLNWLGAKLETDAFGKAMLESGIPKDTIMAWTKDPQVPFEGKKSSLFDLLEDLDYDECLAKAQAIAGVSGKRPAGKQQAYVFIKPHAVTEKTKKLAASKFASAGISARATPPHAALPAH